MKESEVLELVALLQAAYREQISTAERNLWADLFADVEAGAAFGAAHARIRSGDPFMPKVGEILAAVRVANRLSGPEAWERVLDQVRAVGYLGEPRFDEPAIARAVALMGWQRICNSDADSPFPAKEFERIYLGVIEGAERREAFESGWAKSMVSNDLRELTDGIGRDE